MLWLWTVAGVGVTASPSDGCLSPILLPVIIVIVRIAPPQLGRDERARHSPAAAARPECGHHERVGLISSN